MATLTVIVWHWQHFFFDPVNARIAVSVHSQPFFSAFAWLYKAGWLAVDLFFVLSGFVFYALYATAIAEKAEAARSFAIKRLSRLYP